MPQVKEIHTDAILTNMSVMFRNAMFVADKVVPPVPVKKPLYPNRAQPKPAIH